MLQDSGLKVTYTDKGTPVVSYKAIGGIWSAKNPGENRVQYRARLRAMGVAR